MTVTSLLFSQHAQEEQQELFIFSPEQQPVVSPADHLLHVAVLRSQSFPTLKDFNRTFPSLILKKTGNSFIIIIIFNFYLFIFFAMRVLDHM